MEPENKAATVSPTPEQTAALAEDLTHVGTWDDESDDWVCDPDCPSPSHAESGSLEHP